MYPNASFPLWLASLIRRTLCPRSRSRATILTCEAAAGVHVPSYCGTSPSLTQRLTVACVTPARAATCLSVSSLDGGSSGASSGAPSSGLSGGVAIARESKVAAGVATRRDHLSGFT